MVARQKQNAFAAFLGDLRDWLIVAWVLWWSWAYVHGALAHRFPHWLGWTQTLWRS